MTLWYFYPHEVLIQILFNSYVFSQHHIHFVINLLRVRALTAEQTVSVSDQDKKAHDLLTVIFLGSDFETY